MIFPRLWCHLVLTLCINCGAIQCLHCVSTLVPSSTYIVYQLCCHLVLSVSTVVPSSAQYINCSAIWYLHCVSTVLPSSAYIAYHLWCILVLKLCCINCGAIQCLHCISTVVPSSAYSVLTVVPSGTYIVYQLQCHLVLILCINCGVIQYSPYINCNTILIVFTPYINQVPSSQLYCPFQYIHPIYQLKCSLVLTLCISRYQTCFCSGALQQWLNVPRHSPVQLLQPDRQPRHPRLYEINICDIH